MEPHDIENITLEYLNINDANELKEAMLMAYKSMPDAYWKESEIQSLIKKFPEGQIVIKVDGKIAGSALSIIVDYDRFSHYHTYQEIN